MQIINDKIETSEVKIPFDNEIFGPNINFNPCILRIDENTFLMSFYTFRRGKGRSKNKEQEPSIYDDYHMWKGGPESSTWWDTSDPGYVGTGYMILKIIERKIFIHQIFDHIGVGYDTRLSYSGNGKYIVATSSQENWFDYQDIWGIDRKNYDLSEPKCKNRCLSIYYLMLKLSYIKKSDEYILSKNIEDEGDALCPKLQDEEKNWSTFVSNGKTYVSQWLTPKHTVIEMSSCSIIKKKYKCIQ